MPFFSYGIHHKNTPVETREKLALDAANLKRALELSRGRIEELVILSTCNRVEFYGVAGDSESPERSLHALIEEVLGRPSAEFFGSAEIRRGREAVRHIFRVAAGLESLVVGENEILGQMREAFRAAADTGAAHSLLYRLMEKALKIGKDVRAQTRINEGAVSIPSVAVELAEKIFGRLRHEKVMVLGTGEMGTQTLRNLKSSGAEIRYVVSRDPDAGKPVAAEFGGVWLSMTEWESKLGQVDILITSTASPVPVVSRGQVERVMKERRGRPLFCIDIAVPRDIDPLVQEIDDVYLYNIDDLRGVAQSNLSLRGSEVAAAEKMTEDAVAAFAGWMEQLAARPTLSRFETFVERILDAELEDLFRQAGASDQDRSRLKQRIRSQILHYPHEKIKEASQNGGVRRYLEALHSLFSLEKIRDPKDESGGDSKA